MNRYSQGLWLCFAFLSMFVLGFSDNLRGPLFFEIIKHFNLTDMQGAWFYSTSSTFGFFASLASAYLLRRFHLLQILVFSTAVMAIAVLGIGYFKDYGLVLVAAGALGSSMGFMGVAQNSSISFLTSPENQVKAYSALHSMYGLSSVLAPLVVGLGLAGGWHWRDFFTLTAVIIFIFFVVMLISPYPQNWAANHKVAEAAETGGIRSLGKFSIYFSISLAFYVIAEILIGSRLSLYTIRELGLSTEQASYYVTGFYVGLLTGRVLGILVKIPGSARSQLYLSFFLSFITMLAGLYHNPWWFSFTGFAMAGFFPTFVVFLSGIYKKRIGVMMSVAIAFQSFSIVCMHQVVGYISDSFGIKVAFHLGLLFIILGIIFLWRGEIERNKAISK